MGVFVQRHIKQAEYLKNGGFHICCGSYAREKWKVERTRCMVVVLRGFGSREGRCMHGREWNKLCNIRGKMCMLLGCDGCCMWKRSRVDERKHILNGHIC